MFPDCDICPPQRLETGRSRSHGPHLPCSLDVQVTLEMWKPGSYVPGQVCVEGLLSKDTQKVLLWLDVERDFHFTCTQGRGYFPRNGPWESLGQGTWLRLRPGNEGCSERGCFPGGPPWDWQMPQSHSVQQLPVRTEMASVCAVHNGQCPS